jgi:hypothetical protein
MKKILLAFALLFGLSAFSQVQTNKRADKAEPVATGQKPIVTDSTVVSPKRFPSDKEKRTQHEVVADTVSNAANRTSNKKSVPVK